MAGSVVAANKVAHRAMTPPDVGDCLVWLLSDALTNGPLTRWPDRTPNGADVSQSTESDKPTVASGAVEFDGTSDNLVSESALTIETGDVSVLIQFETDNTDSQRTLFSLTNSSSEILKVFHDNPNGDLSFYTRTGGAGGATTDIKTNLGVGDKHHLIFTRSGTTVEAFLDGVSIYTDTDAEHAANLNTVYSIGGAPDFAFYDGKIYEFALFSRKLNASEAAALYQYTL